MSTLLVLKQVPPPVAHGPLPARTKLTKPGLLTYPPGVVQVTVKRRAFPTFWKAVIFPIRSGLRSSESEIEIVFALVSNATLKVVSPASSPSPTGSVNGDPAAKVILVVE